jgi:hypothetical protein
MGANTHYFPLDNRYFVEVVADLGYIPADCFEDAACFALWA